MKQYFCYSAILLLLTHSLISQGMNNPDILDPLPLPTDIISEAGGDILQICYSIITGNINNILRAWLILDVSDTGTDAVELSDYRLVDSSINESIFCYYLTAIDDDAFEPIIETINFTVSSWDSRVIVRGEHRTISIIDNDMLFVDLLNTSAVTIMEGQSEQLCFQIFVSEPIGTSTTFILDTSSSNGELISINSVTLVPSSPPEFMIVRCITITAVNDSIPEGEDTYTVTWINSDNRTVPVPLTNIITIESQLTPSLANETSVMVTEGQSFMVCVELDGAVATKQNNFSYTVISGTASDRDYTPSSGVVSIEPGNMIGCSSILLENNAEVEGTRDFTISFTDSSIDSVMVTIIDDDGTCASEEMSNDPQSYKSEYVRTCFDVNNRGKTIVKDEKGTLTILMCPSN